METKPKTSWLRLGAALSLACGGLLVAHADSSTVRVALQNTGFDPDAAGSILTLFKSSSSQLTVEASKLTPGRSYTFTVGAIPEATFTADNNGRIRATFSTPSKKNKPVLDFDPRGQVLSLRDGANSELEALLSGAGEPAGITVDERVKLDRLSGTGEATASYKALRTGQRMFTVKLENVASGDWSVFVNGIQRGSINVQGRQSTLVFDSNSTKPGRLLLDFDPRGQVVDLALGANLVFTGKLEAKARNVNIAIPSASLAYLPPTGVDANGTARGKLRVDPDARRRFSIEVEDVPVGAYELMVNGALKGTINVLTTASGTEGEIEFSSREDNGDELPLTFDPASSVFRIQRGGVIYFEGLLTGSIGGTNGGGSGTPPGGSGLAPGSFAGFTLNLDDQPGGDLMEFATATTGVDLGTDPDPFTYVFTLLNSSQARVSVTAGDKRDVYVFTFASPNAGSWVRDEYRKGALKDHDTGVFIVVAGGSSGGTNNPPGGSSPTSFSESLSSTGLDVDASGHADFAIDASGRRKFSVEIEDVPVGSYELWVGGMRRGTIVVTLVAGKLKGELEFANPTDDANKLKLTFDPRGQFIEVKNAAGLYFAHLFGFGSVFGGGAGLGGTNTAIVLPTATEVPLFNLGLSPSASAKAEFKIDDRGRRHFEVEMEDAPVGSYALLVAGTQVGTVIVADNSGETRGRIEFEDDPRAGKLLLTFHPRGQEIMLRRDGANYFQRTFPSGN